MSPGTDILGAADDQALLREVVAYYHRRLMESPEALGWLQRHGITSPEAVQRFRLGYSDRTLGLALPERNRKAGVDVRARLRGVGILRESGHETFVGGLVVPVFDEQGAVVQVYGRLIGGSLRKGTKRDLFLPGPMRVVWNRDGLRGREVMLCSGLLDALVVWSAGLRNVTVAFYSEHLREHVLPAFTQHQVEAVVLAYPAEGKVEAEAARQVLVAAGIDTSRLVLPGGHDVSTFVRRRGVAALVEVVRGARRGTFLTGPVSPAERVETSAPVDAEEVAPPAVVPPPGPAVSVLDPERPRSTAAVLDATAPAEAVESQAPQPNGPVASSPPPGPPAFAAPPEAADHEVIVAFEDRRYRVRGLAQNLSYSTLRVNLLVSRPGQDGQALLHADSLDLYAANKRASFVKLAAVELRVPEDVVKRDLGQLLLRLEDMQQESIRKAVEPRRKPVSLSEADRDAALALLRDPSLVDRIVADFERVGVVGEETNKLVAYLAAVSRKLDEPLAVVVQSSSAAGKTSLVDAVLAFVPEEDRLRFSAVTGKSLFYLGETDLQHRVLAVAEDQGAEPAAYAWKLLVSEGALTLASTGADKTTGRLVAREYKVRGPVALFLTSTSISLDDELVNRAVILAVDEDRHQTQAIHRAQRERQTLQGLLARRERDAVLKLHQDAQRLLRPLAVVNPYAPQLSFRDDRTRSRRDHGKYLALIRAVALLHQHQREVKVIDHSGQRVEYIEVSLDDIALANKLAHEVLGRSLDDVPPHTRRLLVLLHEMVTAACAAQRVERGAYRFTRKTVREATGWGDTALKVHLRRLVELEHVRVHGGRGQHLYELLYDGEGQGGERFLAGLIDPEKLRRSGSGASRSGASGERSGPGQPAVSPEPGGGRGGESGGTASSGAEMEPSASAASKNEAPTPASEPPVVPAHVAAGEGA